MMNAKTLSIQFMFYSNVSKLFLQVFPIVPNFILHFKTPLVINKNDHPHTHTHIRIKKVSYHISLIYLMCLHLKLLTSSLNYLHVIVWYVFYVIYHTKNEHVS